MIFQKVGIIGLGLIGGSLAKALKNRCAITNIVAFNRHEDVLKKALEENVISDYTTEIDQTFYGCDIIFICTPVDKIFEYATLLLPYIGKDCIVTDVGSTKGKLHQKMCLLKEKISFIGGHPMTGAEKFRYQASKEHLFENAYYLLTPSETTTPTQLSRLKEMITAIGAIPVVLSPLEHDHIVASISHVPQILASGLVNMVKSLDGKEGYMHQLAAGGFKDITRIASSSPQMWESICFENKEEILCVLEHLEDIICSMKQSLESNNAEDIYRYFDSARLYRDSFANITPNRFTKRYEINVDVVDKPGSIAIIAVLFSSNNINIKNMSIINNRERDNGALLIAFDSEQQRQKSIRLLQDLNYEVYSKD